MNNVLYNFNVVDKLIKRDKFDKFYAFNIISANAIITHKNGSKSLKSVFIKNNDYSNVLAWFNRFYDFDYDRKELYLECDDCVFDRKYDYQFENKTRTTTTIFIGEEKW